jgi:hypothetical protein
MRDQPETTRRNARLKTYNNSEEERAAIRAVDEAVFDKVRQVEAWTVENANRFLIASQEPLSEAVQLTDDLQALRYDLDYTDRVDPREAGARYATLRARVEEVTGKLDRADKESEWLESKSSDPYRHFLDMTDRFPILRPNL